MNKFRTLIVSSAALAATLAWAMVAVNGRALDFSTLFPGAAIANAFPSCVRNGSVITPPTPGQDCTIQPDEQTVSVYRIALCTAKPGAPTALAASATSACSDIFTSTSSTGSPVSIVLNSTVPLSNGTSTKPANGTYTHLYVEVDPEVKIKVAAQFGTAMADSNGNSTGVYCWSKAATTYNFAMNAQNAMPQATACGNSAPAPASVAATSSLYNSMMDDSQMQGGTGFTHAFVKLPTTAGGLSTLDAYLIGADEKLVTTQTVNTIGNVKRVVGVITLPGSGVVVSSATTNVVLGYNNTRGAQVGTQSGASPSRIGKFGNGPFDMTVAVLP